MHRYESTEVDGSIVRPKQIQMQFQTRRQVPKVKAPPKGKRVCVRASSKVSTQITKKLVPYSHGWFLSGNLLALLVNLFFFIARSHARWSRWKQWQVRAYVRTSEEHKRSLHGYDEMYLL
jgi:hypothetical protein